MSSMDNIVKKKEPLLRGMSRDAFIQKIVKLLNGTVDEAYIFGSLASDSFDCDSDVDLLLIAGNTRPFVERPLDYPQLYDLNVSFDVIIYTPDEFKKIKKEQDSPFWKNVLSHMQKII